MNEFLSSPLKLINTIQNYEWGTKNVEAFIPLLTDVPVVKDLPYAELWIGAHPKASSKVMVNDQEILLSGLINSYPDEILGKNIAEKYNSKLPFLFKILSAGKALSIQLHPDKLKAEELHRKDPVNYPDDNHKPEIAVALDKLEALVGYYGDDIIKNYFIRYPCLYRITGIDQQETRLGYKALYSEILKNEDQELLKSTIDEIKNLIEVFAVENQVEKLFVRLFEQYGYDPGVLAVFFLKYIILERDQAVFIDAGVPHAYLSGNIVECMANSDNVVRAGLTPKFKDIKTLTEIMRFDNRNLEIIQTSEDNFYAYKTPADEFVVNKFTSANKQEEFTINSNERINIILLVEGNGVLTAGNKSEIKKGESFLIPAALQSFTIKLEEDSKLFLVTIPQEST